MQKSIKTKEDDKNDVGPDDDNDKFDIEPIEIDCSEAKRRRKLVIVKEEEGQEIADSPMVFKAPINCLEELYKMVGAVVLYNTSKAALMCDACDRDDPSQHHHDCIIKPEAKCICLICTSVANKLMSVATKIYQIFVCILSPHFFDVIEEALAFVNQFEAEYSRGFSVV